MMSDLKFAIVFQPMHSYTDAYITEYICLAVGIA